MTRVTSKSIILSSTKSELIANVYPPIILEPNGYHELAMVSLDMYHSIPNIDNNNCLFYYEYKSEEFIITIPVGSYEIDAINNYIQKKLIEFGHENIFEIHANANTLKCILTIIDADVKINFEKENTMRDMLGFNYNIYSGVGEHEGTNIVNIVSVNSILVNCSIIEGSFLNSVQKPILYSFFPNVPPGYKIVEKPNSVVYLPVTMPAVNAIAVWLTDQNGNLLNIRDETVTISLVLRSRY